MCVCVCVRVYFKFQQFHLELNKVFLKHNNFNVIFFCYFFMSFAERRLKKRKEMKFVILTLMTVSALSTFPVRAAGFLNDTTELEIEEPKTLPLTAAAQDLKAMKNVNEIWQEDEREVLIRNERGAKDNGASGATTTTGKKGKKDHNKDKAVIENNTKNTQQQHPSSQKPLTNNSKNDHENTLNNTNSTTTTHIQEHKKNQHHQKHDNKQNKKNTNNKKHEKTNEDDKSKMIPY